MVRQVVTMHPVEDHNGADTHTAAQRGLHDVAGGCALGEAAAHSKPMQKQVPGRICSLGREAHIEACFLTETEACGAPKLKQSVPKGLYPMEKAHAGAVHERLYSMGDHASEGEKCKQEGVAELKHCELTANLIPHHSLHHSEGRR